MAKFTEKRKGTGPVGKTVNHEGAEAFNLDDESKLLNLVATCMMNEPKFYGEQGDVEKQIMETAQKLDSRFVLQVANYARNHLYLRSVPMYLTSIAANSPGMKPHVREYVPKVVQRADELSQLMACYIKYFGKPIPNSLKKGIADTFPKFDEYQFAKYNRSGDVTFKDVIMLSHPSAPKRIIKKILDEKLKTPETWETEVSEKGNTIGAWHKLIDDEKLGYMAMLRNLRNMLTCEEKGIDSAHLKKVIDYLRNEKAVKSSKQLPFRFFSAYRQLEEVKHKRIADVMDAVEDAFDISFSNLPKMDGTTLIACDTSGSMDSPISERSSIRHVDIGIMLGLGAKRFTDECIFGCFGDSWDTWSISRRAGVSSVSKIRYEAARLGCSTNGWKVIQWLIDTKTKVDRILIFTDEELWDSNGGLFGSRGDNTLRGTYEQYRRTVNKDARLYLFNLNGHGTSAMPKTSKTVVRVNGWSEKIFSFLAMTEDDPMAQVKYVKENF